MEILFIALGVLAALLLLLLVGAYITYRMTFYLNPKKPINPKAGLDSEKYRAYREVSEGLIDGILARPCENVYITSHDGLRLRARYYHTADGAPLVIECHGYKSTPMRDFSGGGVTMMEMGFNVLMIDQRGHGESEGRYLTFGAKESLDLQRWISYSVERFGQDVKIMIQGMSMGAATVLLATELDLPENVIGVLADCPCSSTREIITKTIYDMKLPGKLLYPLVRLGAVIFTGVDPNRVEAKEAVKHHRVPILLIHGEADTFVPCTMSDDIYENIKDDEGSSYHKFPGAEHGISYLCDKERYVKLVRDFSHDIGII